ncbi:sensor histidine kinase [Actinobaculum suis]|uniref:sensor histidine kinase n=1 Tax=Actinobaculum suis TaxID=1657 RepID=UPI0008087F63|nr:histidine kinase [Actinobaculum suis]OCA93871.1 hypothetical protein ACU21_09085 [Actinobaculum suis]OCA95918.1 hypothetical protein ACU20_03555 [Actinobaculum suis]
MERDKILRIAGFSPLDLALALCILIFKIVFGPMGFYLLDTDMPAFSPLDYVMQVLVFLAIFTCLLLRRTHPEIALIIMSVSYSANYLLGTFAFPELDYLVAGMVLYGVGAYGKSWTRYGVIVGLVCMILASAFAWGRSLQDAQVFFLLEVILFLTFSLAGFILGRSRANDFARLRQIDAEAEAARREAEQSARIAVLAERNRIARDMHDVVAHTLSVVIAQADGGRYAAQKDPAAPVQALEKISKISRSALSDIRTIIGVLREGNDGAPLVPTPEVSDLSQLVEDIRATGRTVEFAEVGDITVLPSGTSAALYRICQEAVTNVLKHAPRDARIAITLTQTSEGVTLTVDNDLGEHAPTAATSSDPAPRAVKSSDLVTRAAKRSDSTLASAGNSYSPPAPTNSDLNAPHLPGRNRGIGNSAGGNGIIGMRERAAAFGGTLMAGPLGDYGWRVQAHLPTPGQKSTDFR